MRNRDLAEMLVSRFGGKVLYMRHNAVIWLYNGVIYLVRCSGRNIRVRRPKLFHVDKIVFLLTEYRLLGISDFSKGNLGPKDAIGPFR